MPDIYSIILFTAGILFGVIAAWLFYRLRLKSMAEKFKLVGQLQLTSLEEKLAFGEIALQDYKLRLSELEGALIKNSAGLRDITAVRAALEQELTRIPKLENRLRENYLTIERQQQANTRLEKQVVELTTVRQLEERQAKEKIKNLNETRKQMEVEFQNLVNKIFEKQQQKFDKMSGAGLSRLLNPLSEKIGVFKKRVEEVYDKEARDRAALVNEIHHLKDLNLQISREALNLTNALKGDSKIQGNWGEMILEKVLEGSGLKKGREFEVQVNLKGENGQRFQPDVIIRLPDKRDIIIDSKVSLTAYERLHSASSSQERKMALKEHADSVRRHFQKLSAKKYDELKGIRTLDFVLMFVPIEAAYMILMEKAHYLFNEAYQQNIIIVSPASLMVSLRVIQDIWRTEQQNRNAREIASKAGGLYEKFVGFVIVLEEVGLSLAKAQEAYQLAHNRLSIGRGNLVRRAQAMRKLGIQVKKELDPALLEKAEG